MELSYTKLTDKELASGLAALKGWSVVDGMVQRAFSFDSYKAGLVFASAVGWAADGLNHHPDIIIGYQKVVVRTVTHDAGGITSYDLELAKRVDSLAG